MSALSERISQANRHDWNGRVVERLAADAGERVSHGTAHNVLTGNHGNVKDPTLRAFAAVFRIPLSELRELAGVTPVDEPYIPPEAASRLTKRQRQLVNALIHQLVKPEPERKRGIAQGTATPITTRPRPSRRS